MLACAAVGCKRLLAGLSGRKIRFMTKSTAAVLADALRLETPERAELAAELLGSLSVPADPRAEAAWNVEIDRRLAAITAGAAEIESWESVKRRIETEILGR
jgi:putative addiction module component (TIGR02574 family)